ncbi:TonB family protein [Sphingomonas insulae]|uniref:TonB C-terminal domain-containing protein n=1 Tax=Sphingomonas insulae TaxID=424800 RepID=A0ABN1HSY9_9SPHN|nr:TonB family protein [Sphingomonas insulae]NIJ28873.1 TonB family protein [Sphingomonas insulae]
MRVRIGPTGRPEQQLLRWMASPVLCSGGGAGVTAQQVVRAPDPQVGLAWDIASQRRTMTLDFRIDATGRPLSIVRRTPAENAYVPDAQDVVPAFAASRFAPGPERTGCTVTFTANLTPIAAAPLADVMAYTVFPTSGRAKAIADRLRMPGDDCADPEPAVLLRAFPDFKRLPDQPGYPSWSMVGYDIDRSGKPTRLRALAGSGTPALDVAARKAVAASRFERGARAGCLYFYYKRGTILPPPPAPEEDALRPAAATCPRDHVWDRKPVLTYPSGYSRRSIEGWAIVAYDVAPWGQTGNVRILQAEPTAEFGDAATAMIRNATFRAGGGGYVGCIDRVLYRIRRPGTPTAESAPD